ncbi:YheC/YheD family protein [Paenibacillus alvei]|uniref:YheC/YheD family protein n=1 Tax=Paenibacillus alvei TaxID=44250 RepID=UPI00028843A2|nr:YheC/YheD family protein [Paenibacillus alvei]EJW18825.1 hypothetical protein PAV_2c05930 [Paenibacillus alvei DSM 29]MCY9539998.1 YheC/YheD family protein [Paenibacillus alvei]MCY9733424.1 YheC/YheD family protein [Paenibacillus alvei]MCY9753122.1 YheC/YheD family protein [Paenibacillus alvei]MEC0081469.1 YheC/YheD family protein [Paenibacillus alvei]
MSSRRIFSKWKKTKILQDSSLRTYIPKTSVYSALRLKEMLNQYQMVYVKPDLGTHGKGVMRVTQRANNSFELREGTSTATFTDIESLTARIKKRIGKRKYLIQQGIHMLTHRGRKFDLRVFVQKNLNNKWEVMSILGRKAAAHKIVTNVSSGGKMESLRVLMKPHSNASSIQQLRSELERIGLSVGTQLSKKHKSLKELGLDIALDKNKHPWILEVNTKPAIYVYRTFNPAAYRRIVRNAKAYGRLK